MSKVIIYGIYDESLEAFVQYIPATNEKIAKMNLTKLFKEKRLNIPMLYDYPNTFKANALAYFDDNTGLFENIPNQPLLLDFGSIFDTQSLVETLS